MKKSVAVLLSFLLLVSLLPIDSFASTTIDSGTCGDNLTWTLDSEGTLTINGTGEMYDDSAPWGTSAWRTSVKKAVISTGVTNIARTAFFRCENLMSVSIPNSVTSIGDSAFRCTNLTSVTIPDSVADIGINPFAVCDSLTELNVSTENPAYFSAGNCIIETNTNTLVAGCNASVIPTDGSVTSIGDEAFAGCTGLLNVTIPDSVIYIRSGAFGLCTGLTNVTIPDSVTFIGPDAFFECTNLASVTIPDSVTLILTQTFFSCTSLTTVTIPDSVTYIDREAFWGCTSLESVTIPDSVTSIGENAFYGCDALTSVFFIGTEEQWNANSFSDAFSSDVAVHFLNETEHTGCEILGTVIVREPTCARAGEKTVTAVCTVCGETFSRTETIEKLPHTPQTNPAVAATCTQTGLTEGKQCAVCGQIITAQKTVSKTSHIDADKDGACDMCGISVCKHCGKTHTGPVGGLTQFIHNLIYFFRNLFSKG